MPLVPHRRREVSYMDLGAADRVGPVTMSAIFTRRPLLSVTFRHSRPFGIRAGPVPGLAGVRRGMGARSIPEQRSQRGRWERALAGGCCHIVGMTKNHTWKLLQMN